MLKDGVYVNLPEEPYFTEPRLGSTDLTTLYLQGEGWWWKSHLNPDRPTQRAEPQTFGKALHCLVLEGDAAFEDRFVIMPDKDDLRRRHGANFCVTVGEIMMALERRDMHPKQGSKKDWLIDYAKSRAPDLVIWDSVLADWESTAGGKPGVTLADLRSLRIMVDAIREHDEIGPLFRYSRDNVPVPEVTILYHDEHGIPRRARLDECLPQYNVDLKTMANPSGRPINFALGDHVAKYAYHVQMADHHEARRWMYRFIQQGLMFDGTPEGASEAERQRAADQMTWLAQFPQKAPKWDYAWVFYQKPDSGAGHAPIVVPWVEDQGGDLHRRGYRCRHQAIQTYLRCMKQFGPDKPWTRVEPVHLTIENAKHRIMLPSYIGGDVYLPGEEEAMP